MNFCYLICLALFIKPTCQELVWEEITPKSNPRIPTSRRDAAIAYYESEDAIYVFGGKSAKNQPLKEMFKFDLNTKIWTQVTQFDRKNLKDRFSTVYGSKGDYFYIATGEGVDGNGKSSFYEDIWRFHFPTAKWEELSSSTNKPEKRQSGSGGIHENGSAFILSHGSNDDNRFSNTFFYDTEKPTRGWEEVHSGTNNYNPSYPHARSQQASTMVSTNKMLIFGGCLSGQGAGGPCPSDDSWLYDFYSNEWSELNRCSSPKIASAMARLPRGDTTVERVVLWGGNADSRTTLASDDDEDDEIAMFDSDKKEWRVKKTKSKITFPSAREGHVMVTTKYGVVMFGGEDLNNEEFLSDLWLLKGTSGDAADSEDARDCGRQYFNLIMLHGIFMFIGWAVFLIMGIFAARYFRFLQPLWFRLHMIFQVLGAIFILVGTICGIISVPSHEHFKFAHSIFGYLLFVMVVQQPFNAMLRPQPTEQGFNCGRAFWEIWHRWSGRLVLLCGVINITLGLFLAVAPYLVWILWLAYVGLWLVIFIVAEIVKRPFEKELRKRARKPIVYNSTNPYRISRGQVNTAF